MLKILFKFFEMHSSSHIVTMTITEVMLLMLKFLIFSLHLLIYYAPRSPYHIIDNILLTIGILHSFRLISVYIFSFPFYD